MECDDELWFHFKDAAELSRSRRAALLNYSWDSVFEPDISILTYCTTQGKQSRDSSKIT